MQQVVNAERLLGDLAAMARIGGTAKGGCNRQALTDTDIEGRALFARWCADYGFAVTGDAAGNMFARMQGADDSLPPLVIGSHLDTQPTGGKYDGVLGVLAALEVMRTLRDAGIVPPRPLEVVSWMNEEGARFAPAMMGSGIYEGMLDLDAMRAVTDDAGISVGQELDRHGFGGLADPRAKDIHAYLELHIEQGPILEAEDKAIGVVTGAQGIRWYDLAVCGQETHAGPFPMAGRRDPVRALPRIIDGVMRIGCRDTDARATIGRINALPASRNVVPSRIEMTVDLRHPDEAVLDAMHAEFEALVAGVGAAHPGVTAQADLIWHSPVVAFDPGLVRAVRNGAVARGYGHRDIISGAGHDALMVARRAPTTMIFIPCRDGLSHNEAEHADPAHIAAGANVLLSAVCEVLGV